MIEKRWTILGQPIGKGRPRFRRVSGHAYTPAKTVNWESLAAEVFADGWKGAPLDCPVSLEVTAVFARPKKLMRAKDPDGRVVHVARPDLDNIEKAVADSLSKAGVLRDDSLICHSVAWKFYAAKDEGPRVEVLLRCQ